MRGRMHHVVIDCPEPAVLAPFYAELTGRPVVWTDPAWTVVAADRTSSGIAFQRVTDFRAPRWPDPERPQQMHLDVMVDDVTAAASRISELGGRPLACDEDGYGVYADPVGHPFCLIPRPAWADPL